MDAHGDDERPMRLAVVEILDRDGHTRQRGAGLAVAGDASAARSSATWCSTTRTWPPGTRHWPTRTASFSCRSATRSTARK